MKAFLGITFSFFFLNGFASQINKGNTFDHATGCMPSAEYINPAGQNDSSPLNVSLKNVSTGKVFYKPASNFWSVGYSESKKKNVNINYFTNTNYYSTSAIIPDDRRYPTRTINRAELTFRNSDTDYLREYLSHKGNWYRN